MPERRVFSIPLSSPAANTLADYLIETYGERLPQVLVLVPLARAQRTLREALLTRGGGDAMLLPRIEALGNIDVEAWMPGSLYNSSEAVLPPAISSARRVMLLANLIFDLHGTETKWPANMEQAMFLAQALTGLMDDLARYGVPLAALEQLVGEDFADHWQISLDFLGRILEDWPKLLAEIGVMEPVARHDAMTRRLAAHWREHPPGFPVIAAGTTGSIPATAELLEVIAGLPEGGVILHGLDKTLDDRAWDQVSATHPQYIIKELLERIGVARHQVTMIGAPKREAREAFMRQVMLPAEATERWRETSSWDDPALHYCVCEDETHEAETVALIVRDALEQPEHNVLVVTHNRMMARGVAAALKRFHVDVDDAAGASLLDTTVGVFFRLLMECVYSHAAPVPLLALLKHPLCGLGERAAEVRAAARELERYVLRGVRRADSLEGWLAVAEADEDVSSSACAILREVVDAITPFDQLIRQSAYGALPEILDAHVCALEALAITDGVWSGHDGMAFQRVVDMLRNDAHTMKRFELYYYPGIIEQLIGGQRYYAPYHTHARVRILSPIEARMQQADTVILAGMNEGSWPGAVESDPWISMQMRATLGLPSHDRSVGQAAHDFETLSLAPRVFMTRARKEERADTEPSRWVLRMEAVMRKQFESLHDTRWAVWARQMHTPASYTALLPPQPVPPADALPRRFSVTRVEMLMRDPYGFYAEQVLGLSKLDALDEELDLRMFGTIVHAALERYVKQQPENTYTPSLDLLLDAGKETFASVLHHARVEAFWWPRFDAIASWCVQEEVARTKQGMHQVQAEKKYQHILQVHDSDVHLTARVDRLERYDDGSVIVVDYKTGNVPSKKDVGLGLSPQLPLSGWVVMREDGTVVRDMEYWPTRGGAADCKISSVMPAASKKDDEAVDVFEQTERGVVHLLEYFLSGEAVFLSFPVPNHAPRFSDYSHVSRRSEWFA